MEVVRRGSLRVALPPAQALPLFTARGETLWVLDWRPIFVSPKDGEPIEGGVWLTMDDAVQVIWRVQRYDREAGIAEYLRIVPGNRIAVVRVECAAAGSETAVAVQYRITSLGPAGDAWIAEMTDAAFGDMMKEWEKLIASYLATAR